MKEPHEPCCCELWEKWKEIIQRMTNSECLDHNVYINFDLNILVRLFSSLQVRVRPKFRWRPKLVQDGSYSTLNHVQTASKLSLLSFFFSLSLSPWNR